MITALIFVGLLLGAGYWCYRQGKGSEALANYKSDLAKSKKINEADNEHDMETNSIFAELGKPNGPPSVLHKQDRDR